MNHAVNHQSAEVTTSEMRMNRVTWGPSPSTARNPPNTAMDASTTRNHAGPRAYSPTLPPGGRRQARRYTRWSAVVNELAKKNVSTRPRMPVALRMSSAEANASFAVTSACTLDPEPVCHGREDRRANALWCERGDDDHQREERDERLAGQRDAAIDEFDLEHAVPHPPEQGPLGPLANDRRSVAGSGDVLTQWRAFLRHGTTRSSCGRPAPYANDAEGADRTPVWRLTRHGLRLSASGRAESARRWGGADRREES